MIKDIRFVLFLSSINLSNKAKLVNNINDESKNIYDGEPLFLPFKDDAPQEIPRVILKSKDEESVLQLAQSKIDFIFVNNLNRKIEPKDKLEQFGNAILKNIKLLRTKYSLSVNRVALICTFSYINDKPLENVSKYIDKKILSMKLFQEAQLHLYAKIKLGIFNVNRWLRLIAQEQKKESKQYLINIDINTLDENKDDIDFESIKNFYNIASKEILNLKDKYE